ncbi:MAG: helix-turn-helix transcriptional regulator [Rhodobacterales bacterium]|nr:helix-turn-helix transcriptional regulator [Rhodobacterales bacterium]
MTDEREQNEDRPDFLTTREVADLLRVKERKVYDLAAADEIPHRRITGKLLFPRARIMAWLAGDTGGDATRPAVLSGSHDPLLDWAVRDSGSGLATLLNGSAEGLNTFGRGQAALAGLHLPEPGGWNVQSVADKRLTGCVLIGFARRARGLLLGKGAGDVRGFADLKGRRVVLRQPGAGAATLFERMMAEAGMVHADIIAAPGLARTETDAAAAVAAGEADAALGIEAMAHQFHLGWLPLSDERFDLLIDRRAYFTAPVQTLLAFAGSDLCRAKAKALGGYDMGDFGAVRWLSP